MNAIFNVINEYVFSYVMRFIMLLTSQNFALTIFLFTLIINLALIPLSIKSQKASVQQTLIKPKLDLLKKKYGDDKQKYNEAMRDLYQKENVSMSGGCLPMILRMLLLLSVYYLFVRPISYLTTVDANVINSVVEGLQLTSDIRSELTLISQISAPGFVAPEAIAGNVAIIKEAINPIDFNFFGISLTEIPHFTLNLSNAQWNWIIPILSFAAAILSSIISIVMQKKINPDAPNMAGMMLTMPLISLFIAFNSPCSLGFYWACSSLISGVIQAGIQYFYGPHKMIARSRAKSMIKCYENEEKTLKGV